MVLGVDLKVLATHRNMSQKSEMQKMSHVHKGNSLYEDPKA